MVWRDPERETLLKTILSIFLPAAFLGLLGVIRRRRMGKG